MKGSQVCLDRVVLVELPLDIVVDVDKLLEDGVSGNVERGRGLQVVCYLLQVLDQLTQRPVRSISDLVPAECPQVLVRGLL